MSSTSTPEHDEHSSFIKTPQQLIVVILLSFLVPIIGIIMVVNLVLSRHSAEPNAMTPESVAARIQPVGRVEFGAGEAVAAAPSAPQAAASGKPQALSGKAVYDQTCVACHMQSVAGSPKLGDKAAWIRDGYREVHRELPQIKAIVWLNAPAPDPAKPDLVVAQQEHGDEFGGEQVAHLGLPVRPRHLAELLDRATAPR